LSLYSLNYKNLGYKVVYSTELVVTLIYTWGEYAGNQHMLTIMLYILVGSSETTRVALLYFMV